MGGFCIRSLLCRSKRMTGEARVYPQDSLRSGRIVIKTIFVNNLKDTRVLL